MQDDVVQPADDASGKPSKAKYRLDEAVAAKVSGQAADLLVGFPLYPDVTI